MHACCLQSGCCARKAWWLSDWRTRVQTVGREALLRMEAMAAQHKLPGPRIVARRWAEMYAIPPSGSAAAVGARDSPRPDGRGAIRGSSRPPVPPARSGGFLSQTGSGAMGAAARAAPAAAAAAPGRANGAAAADDATAEAERRLARKRLLDLTYEEYLEVFGRVQEEWWQRQLQESLFRASGGGVGTEEQYVAKCRQNGRTAASDAALRAEYRRMVGEHAAKGLKGVLK